jgi:acyl-CoA reductase-like NAD-dependent aldehyde dehydrogenase
VRGGGERPLAPGSQIVKPDSRTPLSALRLARALDSAGLPQGVLQVVTGAGSEVGAELARDPRVRMISFTGGRATGERIMRDGGLKKYAMELGNNAPVIVLPDADLTEAAESIVSGAFWAAGQNCCTSRGSTSTRPCTPGSCRCWSIWRRVTAWGTSSTRRPTWVR